MLCWGFVKIGRCMSKKRMSRTSMMIDAAAVVGATLIVAGVWGFGGWPAAALASGAIIFAAAVMAAMNSEAG